MCEAHQPSSLHLRRSLWLWGGTVAVVAVVGISAHLLGVNPTATRTAKAESGASSSVPHQRSVSGPAYAELVRQANEAVVAQAAVLNDGSATIHDQDIAVDVLQSVAADFRAVVPPSTVMSEHAAFWNRVNQSTSRNDQQGMSEPRRIEAMLRAGRRLNIVSSAAAADNRDEFG